MRMLFIATLCCVQLLVYSQPKLIHAVKTSQAIKIDGILDDSAWKNAPMVSNLVQNQPSFGEPATSKSEIRILYDNDAVYVSAYLYDDPKLISTQLTARDG